MNRSFSLAFTFSQAMIRVILFKSPWNGSCRRSFVRRSTGVYYWILTLDKHSPLRISCRTLRRWAWPATAVPPRWRRGRPPYWFDSPTPSVFWLVRGQTHACYNIDKTLVMWCMWLFWFNTSLWKIIYLHRLIWK